LKKYYPKNSGYKSTSFFSLTAGAIDMTLKGSLENAKVRVLLALWALDGLDKELNKGKVKPLERSGENAGDYDPVFVALETDGAIKVQRDKSGKIKTVSLTHTGYELLGNWLRPDHFEFEGTQIGARLGNYLLKWIAQAGVAVAPVESAPKISSYDEFKAVALETYERLNFEFNYDHFVPIYRIRRAIGERVTRTEFNDWLIKMQADKVLLLQENTVEDNTRDKVEDSVSTPINGLRCYVTTKLN
jgi:hypothetical protein